MVSVPGLPGSLYFFDIRDNRLNVTWSHPDEINGILQGRSKILIGSYVLLDLQKAC